MRDLTEQLLQVLRADAWSMDMLSAVRSLSLPDWAIGAGFVRSLVWDRITRRAERTVLGDVDVLYFDPGNTSKTAEHDIVRNLARLHRSVPWSAKNQARMHLKNGDAPYRDTLDALSRWLETPTAVAVRLEKNDDLTVLAPFGLEDLFAMVIRPTPAGNEKSGEYRERLRRKRWAESWPEATIIV